MANQSIVAIPTDVTEPTALRRTLERIVEQLDIAIGYRQGSNSLYSSQQELIDKANELSTLIKTSSDSLQQANIEFETTVQDLEKYAKDKIALVEDDASYSFTTLNNKIIKLQNVDARKGLLVDFTISGTTPVVNKDYNVSAVTRTALGVYKITLEQDTFETVAVLDNSALLIDYTIAPTATSDLLVAEASILSSTEVQISVYEISYTTKLVKTAVDISAGDTIRVVAIFSPIDTLPST